jgi:steroid 5-alpha reductase family enzyme
MTQILLTTLATIVAAMIVLWIASLIRRDASIVDPFWGAGFVLVAWLTWQMTDVQSWRAWLLVGLTTAWGLRLSLFLARRNWGHGEDRRYVAMRRYHGRRFWWVSLFSVFLLQAGVLWFVSLPIQAAMVVGAAGEFRWLDAVGIPLWAIGFFFESVGDWQLARFKADPANSGKVLESGLWRYTRHPNYFGDFCVWWGLYLIAAAGGAAWTAGSPALMSLLLMKVSGVSLLERTIAERRPEYSKYIARTSAFFPFWPRS